MDLNDPQERLEGFFPEYEHAPPSSFQQVLEVLEQKTLGQSPTNQYAKGTVFEQLVKAFIEVDKAQRQRFDKVWLWKDYPQRAGRIDTGIDLVARERDGGGRSYDTPCRSGQVHRNVIHDRIQRRNLRVHYEQMECPCRTGPRET